MLFTYAHGPILLSTAVPSTFFKQTARGAVVTLTSSGTSTVSSRPSCTTGARARYSNPPARGAEYQRGQRVVQSAGIIQLVEIERNQVSAFAYFQRANILSGPAPRATACGHFQRLAGSQNPGIGCPGATTSESEAPSTPERSAPAAWPGALQPACASCRCWQSHRRPALP
jgi:hypothetical protein